MATADKGDVITVLIELLLKADFDSSEEEALVAYAGDLTGRKLRPIQRSIKAARQARAEKDAKDVHDLRLAERDDPRPMLPVPASDAPFLPQMEALNLILGKSKDRIPPARNVDGDIVCVRRMEVAGTHAFTSANEDSDVTRKPPPQWIIRIMSLDETAEMIERTQSILSTTRTGPYTTRRCSCATTCSAMMVPFRRSWRSPRFRSSQPTEG